MQGTWGVAVPSPSAQRAAHPAASSLLVTHGRGGLALGDGEEGEPLQFNALQDSKMFVFLAKSLFDVDPIPFLESPEFYAKSGERVEKGEKGHLLTCCRGMSLLLLHRWRPASAPLMTF